MTLRQDEVSWPPQYLIRRHPRALRVKLMVTAQGQLSVTLPKGYSEKKVPSILEKHKPWILQKLANLSQVAVDLDPPTLLNFPALQENWTIDYYHFIGSKAKGLIKPNCEFIILGNLERDFTWQAILKAWVKSKAKAYLCAQLRIIATKNGFEVNKINFRAQKTRWGSCSADGSITLNYKLIFLPDHLIHHILIHELCHLRHLNHSPAFWKLVSKYDANYLTHRRELRKADGLIPSWAT